MNWKRVLTSPIGRKFTMAFTGIFLIVFLIVHAGLNAFIFYDDHGVIFNAVARFMEVNYIMRILELGLFVGFIIHIVQGLLLAKMNKAARPVKYSQQKYIKQIKWNSRHMPLLGVLIFLFLVMHLAHFWVKTKVELYFGGETINLYDQMKLIFTNPVWFVLYMIGLAALLYHLLHGFRSAFQSLGINNRTWTPIIVTLGKWYSWIIVLLFASMPLSFMVGWLQ